MQTHTLTRDVVHAHRLGLPNGLVFPPNALINNLTKRYGRDFFVIDDDVIVSIDVPWNCESVGFAVNRRAMFGDLKENWRIETGKRDVEVVFVDHH
jgi:hypothetical protein